MGDTAGKIIARLVEIEKAEGVRIFYACESGSRAWGFPSADSDYDIRFIYAHRPEWYLSIDVERKSDVIELPIEKQLDINGWDLRKALQLIQKFNPPLMEWLGSPIVYWEKYTIANKLRDIINEFYSPIACAYHYLNMAKGNYREYLKGDVVWIKKYFYVLRPLLAIRWIEKGFGIVPTEFQTLLDEVIDVSELKDEIYAMIESKQNGKELDRGPKIPIISDYIKNELERLEERKFEQEFEKPAGNAHKLNDLFRSALSEIWR